MSLDLALDLNSDFWKVFHGVKSWQGSILSFYEEHGYIENVLGLRYSGPLDVEQLLNYPIQGVASFIVMDALNRLSNIGIQAILNVHDDLGFYIPDDVKTADEMIETIGQVMVNVPFKFIKDANVPITVEMKIGRDWSNQDFVCEFDSRDYKK